ncbi:rhodanese-like domain-containing protein [Thioalkalivibrio sp. ALgr3]|uniref:rhodanese-like domain-containing protein n=1 Tax=Thioalkalivibrio sp. ALgr3 TaxID=1239292 RepID=UPI000373C47C|nr:rhodanese-like domain-containing protein [Thioalkalivibrio sp. ALgr3]
MSEHSDPHGHAPETGAGVPRIHPVEVRERLRERPRDLLVDVRSTMEFLFVGHPVGAVHIPWIDEPDWTVNPDFVPQVRKLLLGGAMDTAEDAPSVYLICRSGKRTLAAAEALLQAGMHNVYSVEEGFEGPLDEQHHRSTVGGWRYHGLPWEQC